MNATLALEGSRSFVSKAAFSEDRRILFLAGLEGSGHHLWRTLLVGCTQDADCVGAPELGGALWSQGDKTGLFNNYVPTGDYDEEALHGVRTQLRALRDPPSKQGLVWVNGASHHLSDSDGTQRTGMMSYPNFGGPEKVYQHPDVWELAKVAEDEGEDLRILFLARQAGPLLLSTAVHRHFGAYISQAVVLAHNARVLASQLAALDPTFVRCVEYEALPSLPEGLGGWLDPAGTYSFGHALADLFYNSSNASQQHRHHHTSDNEAEEIPLRDLANAHLEEAVQELHRVAGCTGAPQRAQA